MPLMSPAMALSTRQEAFCRRYTDSGNAADAARRAGYSERSARQTGCALLERLEQAWDAAAAGSACTMLRVLRFLAGIAGPVGSNGANRARLRTTPHEDARRSDPDDRDCTDEQGRAEDEDFSPDHDRS